VNPTTGAPIEIPEDFGMPGNATPEQRVQIILNSIRPMLPKMLQHALDSMIDLQHLTEVSVDRFIDFGNEMRYNPPASIMELIQRLRIATREIESVTQPTSVPLLDPTLPTYEENERHVRPRVSTGHWRQTPAGQTEYLGSTAPGYSNPTVDAASVRYDYPRNNDFERAPARERLWHDDL